MGERFTGQVAISILITTYNHEEYIAECLQSALMQQVDAEFEILVGVDNGTDRTLEICNEFEKRSGGKVRVILNNPDNVLTIKGKRVGRYNFLNILKQAKGRYIARCDGDDYWTDPLKLQKQLDILEANADCIACHHWHRIAVRNENGKFIEIDAPKEGQGYYPEQITDVGDIFANRVRIKLRTVMFRNIFADGFVLPDWFHTVQFGDVSLSLILGKFGNFFFIDEEMATYRMTGTGVSTIGKQDPQFYFRHQMEWIDIWEKADKWFNARYRPLAVTTVLGFYTLIFKRYEYTFRTFVLMVKYALFTSQFPLVVRLQITCKLIIQKLQKK